MKDMLYFFYDLHQRIKIQMENGMQQLKITCNGSMCINERNDSQDREYKCKTFHSTNVCLNEINTKKFLNTDIEPQIRQT